MGDTEAEDLDSRSSPRPSDEQHAEAAGTDTIKSEAPSYEKGSNYLTGWRLHTLTLG